MNVRELRELLVDLENAGEGDTPVVFSYPYGDYWRTIVASDIDNCQEEHVVYSEYHSMHKVVDTDDRDPEEVTLEYPEATKAICLS